MYKFEDFLKGDFGIHCSDITELVVLFNKLDKLGIKWKSGQRLYDNIYWDSLNNLCIENNRLCYTRRDDCIKFYKVDFGGNNMQFTKNNLEVGQFVILRDECRFLVLKTEGGQYYLSNTESYFVNLDNFNDDLTNKTCTDSDVMKVCVPSLPDNLCGMLTGFTLGKIIWEREEVRELTVAQISERLGYKVKVVE